MTRQTLLLTVVAALVVTGAVRAQPRQITLPPDTSSLRSSDLPGYAVAQQKCGLCHSADYVAFQPPQMTQTQWTVEMTKMRQAYGAPLDDSEIERLGAYLAVAYGSATMTDASVLAASAPAAATSSEAAVPASFDTQAVLTANGCLVCHAVDRKVIGPSFQDVALKYRGMADAEATLVTSIRQGVVGKWGQIPMPAMAGVDAEKAAALARFILAR